MELLTVLLFAFVFFACCFVCGFVAGERGRGSVAWFLIAAAATPLFALLALAALPNERRDLPKL